jgi:hypothetical protein
MELPELIQSSCREVVERFLRPVFCGLDSRAYHFFYAVFLGLFNVVSFPEDLGWFWARALIAGSVGFDERDVEDVVEFPFPGQCELDGE